MSPPRCDVCRWEVQWAVTTNGKNIMLDPGSDPQGCYEIVRFGDERRVRFVPETERPMVIHSGGLLFIPHWASCGKKPPKSVPPPPAVKEKISSILEKAKGK